METIQERYKKLSQEVYTRYDQYLKAHRKALKEKSNIELQKEVAIKKLEWLEAVKAKKMS